MSFYHFLKIKLKLKTHFHFKPSLSVTVMPAFPHGRLRVMSVWLMILTAISGFMHLIFSTGLVSYRALTLLVLYISDEITST